MQKNGYFSFVLHSHLPYLLAHGRWPHGTDWLNEILAECYLPLLAVLTRAVKDGFSPRVTLGITPILTEQLADPQYKEEFFGYLNQKIEVSEENSREFGKTGRRELEKLALFWRDYYTSLKEEFQKIDGNILSRFKDLQDQGHIEIMTSAATHAYLPLLSLDSSISAQIKQGVATYRRHFGRDPRGLWLPECGYRPAYKWSSPFEEVKKEGALRKGLEEFLHQNGLRYFVVDTHMLKGGRPLGTYLTRFEALERLWGTFSQQLGDFPEKELSPYQGYLVASSAEIHGTVTVFTRDPVTALQLWSGERGYPCDGWYLDFHKKYFPGGNKYWRVTSPKSDLAEKLMYEPQKASLRLEENAEHFKDLAARTLAEYKARAGMPGIVCAPFDTELFGHWWFEGPHWLYQVLRRIAADPYLSLVTLSEYLDSFPPAELVSLPEGSWGEGGFHYIWLNESTEWTWRRIYETEAEMETLASGYSSSSDEELQEILKQAGRELLVLESSDWQFLITTSQWHARDYAGKRFSDHYDRFKRLAAMAWARARGANLSQDDRAFLAWCQETLRPFPDLQVSWFKRDGTEQGFILKDFLRP